MRELFRRLQYLFKPSNSWNLGYDDGYVKGFDEGRDFAIVSAYNHAITRDIPRIHSRYAQFQVKTINTPRDEITAKLTEFTQKEIEHFKMELQNR